MGGGERATSDALRLVLVSGMALNAVVRNMVRIEHCSMIVPSFKLKNSVRRITKRKYVIDEKLFPQAVSRVSLVSLSRENASSALCTHPSFTLTGMVATHPLIHSTSLCFICTLNPFSDVLS